MPLKQPDFTFSSPVSKTDGWFGPKRFSALLALFIIALFPDVLLGRDAFFFRDYGIFGYPLAFYHRESFWRGELPLWNPLNHCGLPFLAQWNTLVLYPLSLIYVLLPLPWSLSFFCLLHLFLAGLGMYFLAHQWTASRFAASVAGLAFAFSGLLLSSLKWPNNIAALGLMPWVVLWVARAWQNGGRGLLVATGAAALQMLSGAPEIILLTWMLLAALWAEELVHGRKPRRPVLVRFCAVILLVAGLCSAQLLPFLDLLAHSQRDRHFADSAWAMPVWGWANFLVPLFRGFPSYHGVYAQYDQFWISSYYVAIGVLGLALLANWRPAEQRVRLLSAVGAVSLILALGDQGYVYRWLRESIPAIGFFRYPIKFVVLAVFVIPLLAAIGVAHGRFFPDSNEAGKARRPLLVIALLFSGTIAAILWLAQAHPLAYDQWTETWRNALTRVIFLALGFGILAHFRGSVLTIDTNAPNKLPSHKCALVSIVRTDPVYSKTQLLFRLLLLFLVWLDASTHAPSQNPTIAPWVYDRGLAQLKPFPAAGESRALLSPSAEVKLNHLLPTDPINDYLTSRLSLFCNCNLLEGIPKVDGFYSLNLREEAQVHALLYAAPERLFPSLNEFLGVSQMTVPGKTVHWAAQTNYMPWSTAGQRPVFENVTNTLRLLSATNFNPREVVCLPPEAKDRITVRNQTRARIVSAAYSAYRVSLEVEAAEPSLVVMAQSYYHPWQARVNGAEVPIWRANHAFQAVQVPAGRCQVQFAYRDHAFYLGCALSIATILGCLVLFFRLKPDQNRIGNGKAQPAMIDTQNLGTS